MKAFTLMALFTYLPLAMVTSAQDQPTSQQENAIEEYAYGMQLGVAHITSSADTSSACGIVPARMIYENSNGQKHTVEHRVWDNGCINS